jgi:hypothetical protein
MKTKKKTSKPKFRDDEYKTIRKHRMEWVAKWCQMANAFKTASEYMAKLPEMEYQDPMVQELNVVCNAVSKELKMIMVACERSSLMLQAIITNDDASKREYDFNFITPQYLKYLERVHRNGR